MKRFVVPFLAVFALLTPLVAQAEWVTKEIKWRISGIGPTGTSTTIWVRDTTYQAVGGTAGGDTTATFSLDDATVPPRGATLPVNATGQIAELDPRPLVSDTCTVAWLLIQADSSAATTATATSVTVLFDGKVGGIGGSAATLGEGWVKADSAFINGAAGGTMTTGDDAYGIPIRSASPYGNVLRWGELRARVSPATGSIPAARVFLRYYRPDVRQVH